MRTHKKSIINCLLSMLVLLLLNVCKPNNEGPSNNDTDGNVDSTVIVPKKYLTKQLLNDDPEKIMLSIDWNEDCSRINHVKYGTGNGHCVDYEFVYYGGDSIGIHLSIPSDSYPLWSLWYDSVTLHLTAQKIDSICCYLSGQLQDIEHYVYDAEGHLIERSYVGVKDVFQWEEDNVVYDVVMLNSNTYTEFTDYYHPHCNLPFYLSSFVSHEVFKPLFTPLWKYQPKNTFRFEVDDDNYVTKAFPTTYTDQYNYFYTYYYTTPKTTLP